MVHLGMACRGIAAEEFPCDIIGPFYYEDDVVRQPVSIRPGKAAANEKPGLGWSWMRRSYNVTKLHSCMVTLLNELKKDKWNA